MKRHILNHFKGMKLFTRFDFKLDYHNAVDMMDEKFKIFEAKYPQYFPERDKVIENKIMRVEYVPEKRSRLFSLWSAPKEKEVVSIVESKYKPETSEQRLERKRKQANFVGIINYGTDKRYKQSPSYVSKKYVKPYGYKKQQYHYNKKFNTYKYDNKKKNFYKKSDYWKKKNNRAFPRR
jgi:hypothetical protein